jgi:superoxide dismutase, Cu-Zn family
MIKIITIKQGALAGFCISSLAIFSMTACNDDAGKKENANSDSAAAVATDSATAANNTMPANSAMATITGTMPDTAVNGIAQFTIDNGKVKMVLEVTIPTKAGKEVAVHLHEAGNCNDTAKAAGAHWNPTNAKHGKWGSDSFHSGDIGNVKLDKDGKGKVEIESDLWSIGGAPTTDILNKSIIVHGGKDDYKTQPSGNPGGRIGCGIINAGK